MCEHGRHHRHEVHGWQAGPFGPGMGYGYGEHPGGHCCCCGQRGFPGMAWRPPMHFHRRFSTREERIAQLEEYLKALQAEAKAVEERLAEMKAGS